MAVFVQDFTVFSVWACGRRRKSEDVIKLAAGELPRMGTCSEIEGLFYVDQSVWFLKCKSCPRLERSLFFFFDLGLNVSMGKSHIHLYIVFN